MQEDGSQNARSGRQEVPQTSPGQNPPRGFYRAENEGSIEILPNRPTPDDKAPIGNTAMQEDGEQDVRETLEEPQCLPQWTDSAEGEGPIETAGAGPSQKEPVPIPPPSSLQQRGSDATDVKDERAS